MRGETKKEEEELDEMNSTASAGGEYMTPNAFAKPGQIARVG